MIMTLKERQIRIDLCDKELEIADMSRLYWAEQKSLAEHASCIKDPITEGWKLDKLPARLRVDKADPCLAGKFYHVVTVTENGLANVVAAEPVLKGIALDTTGTSHGAIKLIVD